MESSLGSGGVLKKKSSSGCLIIKKKGENKSLRGGLRGLSIDGNERKRHSLVSSDSSSMNEDESLEFIVNGKKFENGSMAYKKSGIENRRYVRSTVGIEIGGERKRSRFDLYDFDRYNEFCGKNTSNENAKESYGIVGCDHSVRNLKDFGVGSSIRVQGKNGVLKVMVNKNKKFKIPPHYTEYNPMEVETRDVSRSEKVAMGDLMARSRVYSDSHPHENQGLLVAKDSKFKEEKQEIQSRKLKSDSSKCISNKVSSSSKRVVKKEIEKSSMHEKHVSAKGEDVSESKAKRGQTTEKQMLREKIRAMLIDAGWTIDRRPRKNRDYLDAVYINPSGTAYWSIVKAYDALKKQLGEESRKCTFDVGSPSFAPLSEDLIGKLTRQTKKKIEEAKVKKTKNDSLIESGKKSAARYDAESSGTEDSCGKQNPKSKGGKCQESYQESEDGSSDDSLKKKTSVASSSLQGSCIK